VNCDEILQALKDGSLEEVRQLVAGKNLAVDCPQVRFAIEAVATRNLELITVILDAGADVNLPNEYGEPPLLLAFTNDKMVKLLISRGADVNFRRKDGTSLLASAPTKGVLKQLLDAGASVDAADNRKQTPLHIACNDAKAQAVEILLKAGADVNAETEHGSTPLLEAVCGKQKSRLPIVEALLAAGANINHLNKSGSNVFLKAALQGASVEVVERLVQAGVNTQHRSTLNENALDIAIRFGQKHLHPLLTEICKP
jgi:ankyrin repeat protein